MNARTLWLLALASVAVGTFPALSLAGSAEVITEQSQLLSGPAAQGQVGDLLLSNEHVVFIIESHEHANGGEALSGGHLVDAAPAGTRSDRLDHVVVSLVAWPRQALYTSVTVESDGTTGPAVIRAEGRDSELQDVQVVTRYMLDDGDRAVWIETTVTNDGDSALTGYAAGDAIDWSYGDNFAPGYGFDVAGLTTYAEWVGCHDTSTSYAYGKPSGTFRAEHGHLWSDTWLATGDLEAGGSMSFTRLLAVGERGLSSANEVIVEAQGFTTGSVQGLVSDVSDGTGIPGAVIDCYANGVAPYTRCVAGDSGTYGTNLPAITFSLDATAEGYFDESFTTAVAAAGTTRVDFPLMPSDYPVGRGDTLTVVMRPIITVPEIVLGGGSFPIEAIASPLTTGWTARIGRGSATYELPIEAAAYEQNYERWFLTAAVPEGLPEEVYDLVVEASGGICDTVAHCVAVRDSIPSDFYFAQITDTHLPTHLFYGSEGWDTDESEMADMRAVIEDLNLANPAFVLLTGDLVNEGEAEDFMGHRAFTKTQALLEELTMPVFAVIGNHDVGGWESLPPPDGSSRREWWRFFGWRYLGSPSPGDDIYTQNYSFDFGGVHFVGLEAYANYDGWRLETYGWESFTTRQIDWLLDDLALVDEEAPKVLFYHYDFDHELNLGALGVDCALWGHIHSTSGSIDVPPYNLATESVCDGERAMRFIHVSNGTLTPHEPDEAGANGLKLRALFDVPNDGTRYRNTVTIINEHHTQYEDALLRLRAPADSIPYRVDSGRIDQTIVEGNVATCYVHVSVPAQGSTSLSIEPTEDPLDGALMALSQSYPNPSAAGTTFRFMLASAGETRLSIYDLAGRLVRKLHDGEAPAGESLEEWDLRNEAGRKVAPGVYFARLEHGGQSVSRKLVVIR